MKRGGKKNECKEKQRRYRLKRKYGMRVGKRGGGGGDAKKEKEALRKKTFAGKEGETRSRKEIKVALDMGTLNARNPLSE